MKLKHTTFILLLLFIIPFSFAVSEWLQGSNANIYSGSTSRYYSWSTMTPNTNPSNNTNYTHCLLDKTSTAQPMAYDIDGDLQSEVVFYDNSGYIVAYEINCVESIRPFNVSNMDTSFVVTDFNSNALKEITYTNNKILYSYEYNYEVGSWNLVWSINYSNYQSSGTTDFLSCYTGDITKDNLKVCLIDTSLADTLSLNYSSNSIRVGRNSTLGVDHPDSNVKSWGSLSDYSNRNDLYYFKVIGQYSQAEGSLFEITNSIGTSVGYAEYGSAIVLTGIEDIDAHIAEVEGIKRALYQSHFDIVTSGDRWYSSMCVVFGACNSTTGRYISTYSSDPISNWAVADVRKNGNQFACRLTNSTRSVLLSCYDSLGSYEVEVNYSISGMKISDSLVMADFNNSETTALGIATKEGIFYPSYAMYRTGFNSSIYEHYSGSDIGYKGIVFSDAVSSSPVYVYMDNEVSFIMYQGVSGSVCGDGICTSGLESGFSCPADCNESFTGSEIGDLCFPIESNCGDYMTYFGTLCQTLDLDYFAQLACDYLPTYEYRCEQQNKSYFLAKNAFIYAVVENVSYLATNIEDIYYCPLGCINNQCVGNTSSVCSPGYQVCSDGLDFNTYLQNGSVYTCNSLGSQWLPTKTCNVGLNCTEMSITYADCINSTTIIGNSVIYLGDDNKPCTNNSQCNSNYCYMKRCQLKGDYQPCTSYKECVSQTCMNGKCTKAGLWNNVDYGAKHAFGSNSLDFVVILICALVCLVFLGIAIKTNNPIAIVGAIVFAIFACQIILLFFAVKGWISGWWFIITLAIELLIALILAILFLNNK